MRLSILVVILCAGSAHAVAPGAVVDGASSDAPAVERELILAGGALRICASLSPRECDVPATVNAPEARTAPRYALDADGLAAALDVRLWPQREAARSALQATLPAAQRTLGVAPVSRDRLVDALQDICPRTRAPARACARGERSAWLGLDDDSRAAVLAALELPQRDGDVRRREQVSLAHGRTPHGAAVLRAFVGSARVRAGGARPRVAFVTASAFDPFDPVDFYAAALRDAGTDVEWWPLDGALAAAVFDGAGCAALPALRLTRLRLPARERVYPDLVAAQRRACAEPDALAALPARVHGVFFAGGDQWKLRQAFFDADDQPNAWLQALRAAHARGALVVGGTSAGSAVQSGGPMPSNGTPAAALGDGAIASVPPAAGCARSGDCAGGLDEDAFTYWPAGGLGLAPDLVVDTHFSERARELRLLRLLADTRSRVGVGVDETSALHLRWREGGAGVGEVLELRALGAAGGWLFDASPGCRNDALHARVHYIAAGATLRRDAQGAVSLVRDAGTPAPATGLQRNRTSAPALPADALADGALRAAAQALAAGRTDVALAAGADGARVRLSVDRHTQRWQGVDAAHAGIGPLTLALSPFADCVTTQAP